MRRIVTKETKRFIETGRSKSFLMNFILESRIVLKITRVIIGDSVLIIFQSTNPLESQNFAGEVAIAPLCDRTQGAKVAAIAAVLHHRNKIKK